MDTQINYKQQRNCGNGISEKTLKLKQIKKPVPWQRDRFSSVLLEDGTVSFFGQTLLAILFAEGILTQSSRKLFSAEILKILGASCEMSHTKHALREKWTSSTQKNMRTKESFYREIVA